jgi:tRNA threonylcarbamoyladenosine biosynthesis protein TsaE
MLVELPDMAATEALGCRLATLAPPGIRIYLTGELGAGKTTLVRGYLRSLGVTGAIKSPTYTLVEPYDCDARRVYHLDLYRLETPEALEYLGFRDYLDGTSDCLIEWPERAAGMLPAPDLALALRLSGSGREGELSPASDVGRKILKLLAGKGGT